MRLSSLARCAVVGAIGLLAAPALASDLNPPFGPVADTGPTQIFELPYTIDASGSYVIALDLTGPIDVNDGVTINASDVVLDLGGHTLIGGAPIGNAGVRVDGAAMNVTIRNGTMTGWIRGVESNAPALTTQNLRVEDLQIRNCESGVYATATGNAVIRCQIDVGSILNAIALYDNALIVDCTVNGGGATAIIAGRSSRILNCAVSGCDGDGIAALQGSVIENCVARECLGTGISVAGGVIRGCAAYQNGAPFAALTENPPARDFSGTSSETVSIAGVTKAVQFGDGRAVDEAGLQVTNGGTIVDSTSRGNVGDGVRLSGNLSTCSVINSTIADNRIAGVRLYASGGSVLGCTIEDNDEEGVVSEFGATGLVSDCNIRANGADGVRVDSTPAGSMRIVGSTISLNAGHGVNAEINTSIESTSIHFNIMLGVRGLTRVHINACDISSNRFGGVELFNHCSIRNSTCNDNGVSGSGGQNHGVHLTGSDCEVDECIIGSNFGNGIQVDGQYNFVTRNRLHADTIVNTGANSKIATIQASPIGAGPWDNFSF